ncbi:10163_t:CDS:10 [Paraglomus occultum]|uniref:RNA helicase n=1 Tax=Paraglomus occultum TaxID=144539 RepID=A0A9N9F5U0_9GLOM|nr:10163_t:CDS:10 [Paraglomus occultum]
MTSNTQLCQLLSSLTPGATTSFQAFEIENGPINPFTSKPFSQRYYDILQKRRQLPVFEQRENFLQMVHSNQFIVVVGETGTGKTTQIPQYLLYDLLPHLSQRLIACTQPRRVAATSVAQRVAEELDVKLGEEVGYSIRFEDITTPRTMLKYMTDGVLLREAIGDPRLEKYQAIILDEAHERTLATDILMGIVKEVRILEIASVRSDLKVIIMSATLDAEKFQKYFNNAPVIKICGRTYPVQIVYSREPAKDYVQEAIKTVTRIHNNEPPGDILVFLTGEKEIEDACRIIRSRNSPVPLAVIPLYSTLPPHMQQLVFDDPPVGNNGVLGRKCIVATNIAESSITIDGVVYVVDTGFAKQKVYNPRIRVESLLVSPISKASAKQRAGRAGRTRPGKCYRLYTETAYEQQLKEQPYPEILRSNIGSVVLQLKAIGFHDLLRFDFMDPPAPETLMRALESLNYLGAIDDDINLTHIGQLMSQFPLSPELSKIVIESDRLGCSDDIIIIAALLSAPIIFVKEAPSANARTRKQRFVHPDGDHLTLLNIFREYTRQKSRDDWCQENSFNPRSLKAAENIRTQLAEILTRNGLKLNKRSIRDPLYSINIRKALISGFFMQAAHRERESILLTCQDNQAVTIHPTSVLREPYEWVIYNEFVLTTKNFIRTVTKVELSWLKEAAPRYFDPQFFPQSRGRRKLAAQTARRR